MLQNKCIAQDMAGLSVRQPVALQGVNVFEKREKNGFIWSKKWPIVRLLSKKQFMTTLTLRSKAWPWSILHIWSTFLSSCWNLSIATWQLWEFVLELWRLVCKKTWGVRAGLSWTCHYTAPWLVVAVCLLYTSLNRRHKLNCNTSSIALSHYNNIPPISNILLHYTWTL